MNPWEKPRLIKKENRWVVAIPVDDRTFREVDITEDMNGWIEQSMQPAFERAAQLCRYYLKHQNFSSWGTASEYERGCIVACENLEKIMMEEGQKGLTPK